MRHDLEGLEITRKELQSLTNLPVNDELIIIINPLKKSINNFLEKLKGPEGATAFFIGFGGLFAIYILSDFWIKICAAWLKISSWVFLIIISSMLGIFLQIFLFLRWKKRTRLVKKKITHSLQIILADVDRYNTVIKAIDINDQIESAGNPEVKIKERNKVIEALKLTRADLVRALMTERILRENKKFIINNTELFANNLTALATMQVTEQATDHGRFLNEALQIALDVQHEMRRLQNS